MAHLRALQGAQEVDAERMEGREFEGHNPPTLDEVQDLVAEATPDQLHHYADLHTIAYQAIRDILEDPDASAASKVQAAKIVQAAKEADDLARASSLPRKIVFETAAYIPELDAVNN